MIGPLNSIGLISSGMGFLLALGVGFFFGFFLERGGLGNPRKLTGVFYATDFAVPKAMFTAIVTASVGLYLLTDLKLIDISRVWIVPTYFWPQIVGGALFGVGYVISGYCPGTAVVGLGTGRIDALLTLGGISAGSLLFAWFYPLLEHFYSSSAMGVSTLPEVMHIGPWTVIGVVAAFAVFMFVMLERFEKRAGRATGKKSALPNRAEPVGMATAESECTSLY